MLQARTKDINKKTKRNMIATTLARINLEGVVYRRTKKGKERILQSTGKSSANNF